MELNYVNFVCVYKLTNENHSQARLAEIEARHGVEAESREAVRRLTRRRSRSDEIGDDHHHDGDDDGHDNHRMNLFIKYHHIWICSMHGLSLTLKCDPCGKKNCVWLPCEMGREKEWLNGLTACQMDWDYLAISQSRASSIRTNTFYNLNKHSWQSGQIQFAIWTNTVCNLISNTFIIIWKITNFQKIPIKRALSSKASLVVKRKQCTYGALWNFKRMMKVFEIWGEWWRFLQVEENDQSFLNLSRLMKVFWFEEDGECFWNLRTTIKVF